MTDPYRRYWESNDPERRHVLIAGGIPWEQACRNAADDWAAILDSIPLPKAPTVLEWGCGAGRLLRACPLPGARLVGVDMSRSMLAEARYSTPEGTTLLESPDGMTCPEISPESIDFCYSFTVLQHVPTQAIIDAIFHSIARALKPGGVFRMQTHRGPPHPEHKFGEVYGRYYPDGNALAADLERHGFNRISTESGLRHADWLWASAWKPGY